MNTPNALLERPEIHQNGHIGASESPEATPLIASQPDIDAPYSPLSTFIISSVLEHNREMSVSVVQERLGAMDIPAERVVPFLEKTLIKHGLIDLQDGVLSATASGVSYIARHTANVEEVHQRNSVKKPKFAHTKYQVLDTMQAEAGPDGRLLDQDNTSISVFDYLEAKLGCSHAVIARRMWEINRAGLTNYESCIGPERKRITVNARLTPQGEADLEEIRMCFPEEIAELKAGTFDKPKPAVVKPDKVKSTFIAMTDEINNMLLEMGKPPRDFTKLEQGSPDEMKAAIERLRPIMQTLEKRLDATNPKLLR